MHHLQLATVPVFVSDQQRALAFYRDQLGFQVTVDFPIRGNDRWLSLAPYEGGTEILLFRPGMYGEASERLATQIGSWTGMVFRTDVIQRSYDHLRERGVPFASEPKLQHWGGLECSFSDPDGNRFNLVQRPAGMHRAGARG